MLMLMLIVIPEWLYVAALLTIPTTTVILALLTSLWIRSIIEEHERFNRPAKPQEVNTVGWTRQENGEWSA